MSDEIPRLQYTRNWEDPADFSTRQHSEVQNRKDIQRLFTEIETYLNHVLLPVLETGNWGGGGSGGSGSGDFSAYLPLNGGIMRGVLRLFRNPQFSDEAATKQYVDTAASNVIVGPNQSIAAISRQVGNLRLLVEDPEAGIAALNVRAGEIASSVQDNADHLSTLTQRAGSIETSVQDLDGEVDSRIRQFADSISMEISAPYADGGRTYSTIALHIGENAVYGQILMDGNVDISGQLSAEALYAACGEVADLEVDRLSTSRRIVRYLAGDQSDDNYIRIREQVLEFVAASCLGGARQAATPAGDLLYWPCDVSGLPRGLDGYPRLPNDERVFTSTRQTEYPVMVYTYQEAVKRSIRFVPGTEGHYESLDTFGAGNQNGLNQGFLQKTTDGMELWYVTSTGKRIGLNMGVGGFVDITGLRRTASLNFSRWDNGIFTEQVEGTADTFGYSVTFDAQMRPTAITDGSGHSVSITW